MKKLLNSAAEQVSIQEGLLQKTKEASAKLDNQAIQVKQISKDLQKRGMTFVGSVIIYSYLQAIGVIYSHDKDCFMYKEKRNNVEDNQ